MIDIDIRELFPNYLLNEKTGRAMAKAIERAFVIAGEAIQAGIDAVLDVEKMPEWRLDEMARELNVLYDYGADTEAKRAWIRDAMPMYRLYGTPEAVYRYLRGLFNDVEVEEWWQYGAEPYHFRVRTSDIDAALGQSKKLKRMVAETQNLRSVFDGALIDTETRTAQTYAGAALQTVQFITIRL